MNQLCICNEMITKQKEKARRIVGFICDTRDESTKKREKKCEWKAQQKNA